ncbi:hypothetical protein LMH87_001379 [Akanthomyces muscarius]|uniref:DUF2427 domain-containing protein n=1 Tax=Akanthomyces muscarius TaxID=2231603 RepID=A0A9W8Q470_AKAMU|nr:hypothetical protein LMH87_001379 [Akanthomyces muscarius]KAJ4146820.1 hypothetical protein LMH87_001379 [Akanthomyces muscarius]
MKSPTVILAPLALFISPTIASKAYGGLDNETKTFKTLVAVHGALMAFCFVILFPLGATLIHVLKRQSVVWFHGVWQIVTLLIALIGFGLGIYMVHHSRSNVSLWKSFNGHPVIGTIIIALLLIQPIGGAIHHSLYKKRTSSTCSPEYKIIAPSANLGDEASK